jgi:hypothetical protein
VFSVGHLGFTLCMVTPRVYIVQGDTAGCRDAVRQLIGLRVVCNVTPGVLLCSFTPMVAKTQRET